MRRLAVLPVLFAAACAFEDGTADTRTFPDLGAADDEPAVQSECSSPLGEAIFEGTKSMIASGTVPASLYATDKNVAEPDVLVDGPEIFPAMRELIASAKHHVSLQTYVWEQGSDPANEILQGLLDLAARRRGDAPDGPPVTVRFLFDASTLGFGSNVKALPQAFAAVAGLGLDPRYVKFEIAGFYHFAVGALHVKTLVVDGRAALITGANPQAHHNYAQPWRDSGFRVSGEVAVALLADFDHAWMQSHPWTCGADETIDFLQCQGTPEKLAYEILPAEDATGACRPMLVTSREADIDVFSNRIDNTQDQAFLAAFGAAKSHIRMQTPNLNDDAAKAALLGAVKRGVRVEIVLSKGFNDVTEMAPGQGGTNLANVAALHTALAAEGVTEICDKLQIRWYSRDGLRPIEGNGLYASHAKYASIDDTVAIAGTANMDTQSWNNSREVNIVVDDALVTQAWDRQLFTPDFERGILVDQCPTL